MGADLDKEHLADLHAMAAEAGVAGFRKLPRAELIEAILAKHGGVPPPARSREEVPARAPAGEAAAEPEEAATAEPVTGVLDVMPDGYGFLRLEGLESGEADVYVSPSQIRRCELRAGDLVSGGRRNPRRGERHPALVRVEEVNGADPEAEDERRRFEDLTPVEPSRRLRLSGEDLGVRAVDLLAPLALGQRVLAVSEPRGGRTTLLRALAGAIDSIEEGPTLVVVLADERPEEVTRWRRELPGADIVAGAADRPPTEQLRLAELALARAKRRVEAGEDIVLVVDSLSRLALGYRDPARVKAFFGSARELEEEGSGSLTIIASVVVSSGALATDAVFEALATTENALVRLDSELAAAGVFPPIRPSESGTSAEERVREPSEMEQVRRLRASFVGLGTLEAARALSERLQATRDNAELLAGL